MFPLHWVALRQERQDEFTKVLLAMQAVDQRLAQLVRDALGAVREHGPGPGLKAVLAEAGFNAWLVEKRAAELRLAHLAAMEALDYRPKSSLSNSPPRRRSATVTRR